MENALKDAAELIDGIGLQNQIVKSHVEGAS